MCILAISFQTSAIYRPSLIGGTPPFRIAFPSFRRSYFALSLFLQAVRVLFGAFFFFKGPQATSSSAKIRSIKSLPVSLQAGINFREADLVYFLFPVRTFGSLSILFLLHFLFPCSFNCSAFDAVDTRSKMRKLTRSATGVAPLLFFSSLCSSRESSRPADCQSFPRKFSRLGNQPDLSKYQRVAFNLRSNNK